MELLIQRWIAALGLAAVVALSGGTLRTPSFSPALPSQNAARAPLASSLQLLAVGDVNLGRAVGQEILKGDTLYPFAFVQDTFAAYDIVIANLESNLSNQNGETQDPEHNLVFTGPPAGAMSLRRSGITVVSRANNHALDYGVRAWSETMNSLEQAGVIYAGTSSDSSSLYVPARLRRNGIKIAFFSVTDVMNMEDEVWKRYVAAADTSRILPSIRAVRDSEDFVIVSYHGGEEYAEHPTPRTREFALSVIAGGADLFLGHHPHVSYGIEKVQGKYIVYSLGNFVFRQPAHFWTQRSFAFAATLTKDSSGTRISAFRCLPVVAGLQPQFLTVGPEADLMHDRIKSLSSRVVTEQMAW